MIGPVVKRYFRKLASRAASRESLTLEVSGAAGRQYELSVWNPAQVASVDGAKLVRTGTADATIKVQIPTNASEPYLRERITVHFLGKAQ